jgi:hypothetical protein
METAAAMVAALRVVARTSACRVAGGLVSLEDAGPADAVAGRGTEGALAGEPPRPQRPSGLAKCAPRGATKSALEGLFSS